MHIPSPAESIAYFKELGYDLIPTIHPSRGDTGWCLIDCEDNDIKKNFNSLLDLWYWWMRSAQQMINEDDSYHAFVSAYDNGDDQRKKHLIQWIDDYWQVPMGAKSADRAFTPLRSRSTDDLPLNWKPRAIYLFNQYHDMTFTERVRCFLNRVKNENKLLR